MARMVMVAKGCDSGKGMVVVEVVIVVATEVVAVIKLVVVKVVVMTVGAAVRSSNESW